MIDASLILEQNDTSIRSFAYKECSSPENAEDAIQYTKVVVWNKINSFKDLAKVTTLLFVVVKNECSRLQKKMFGRDFHGELGGTSPELGDQDHFIHEHSFI